MVRSRARRRYLALPAVLLLAAVACRTERVPTAETPAGGRLDDGAAQLVMTGDHAHDRSQLAFAEAAAKKLVRTDGCDRAGECGAAPVGAKACGGPRYYLLYCRRTTDEVELLRRLAEIERFEREFNRHYSVGSTCDFVSPPGVELAAGACRAAER
jgi:hypothetical protein